MKIGLFYGTTLGSSKKVAELIAQKLDVDIFDVASGIDRITQYDKIILGSNTWGYGDLQDDWENVRTELEKIDFSNKKVAIYGTGDQYSYSDTFVDAIGILAEIIEKKSGTIIGSTSTENYNFSNSKALKNGSFLGLAIDEDNQSSLTIERVDKWVEILKGEF